MRTYVRAKLALLMFLMLCLTISLQAVAQHGDDGHDHEPVADLPTSGIHLTIGVPYHIEVVDVPFSGASETDLFGINNAGDIVITSFLREPDGTFVQVPCKIASPVGDADLRPVLS